MKKRALSLLLAAAAVFCLTTPAAAADAGTVLTAGGSITLTEDLALTGDVTITKDTVLDLNGHKITGFMTYGTILNGDGKPIENNVSSQITVAGGAAVTIKNGSLYTVGITNEGTITKLEDLKISSPEANNVINNKREIGVIRRCTISGHSMGIGNYADIGLLDNCDVSVTVNTAVANGMFTSELDDDGKSGIDEITRCRFISTDTVRGSAFAGGEPNNSPMVISDSVLVGYGRGIHCCGNPVTIRGSVIVNTSTEWFTSNAMAVWVVSGADGSTPPRLESCTLIAADGPCGYGVLTQYTENGKLHGDWHYEELADMVSCTYLPLSSVSWQSYTDWTMAAAAIITRMADEGLRQDVTLN